MKSILAIIFISLLIFGCNQLNRAKDKEKEKFNAKLAKELKSGIRNDTIFLGFTFGMTEQQFINKAKKLVKNGVLTQSKTGQVTYDLNIGTMSLTDSYSCSFFPEYDLKGRLYKLRLNAEPKDMPRGIEPNKYQIFIVTFFDKKYGFSYDSDFLSNETKHSWINGNRLIEIYPSFDHVSIVYTDYPVMLKLDSLESVRKLQEVNKAADAI